MTAYAGEDVEQGEYSFITDGRANVCSHFGGQHGSVSKNGELIYLRLNITTLWHIPKVCPIISQEHLLNYVHSSFIHNSWNLSTT